MSRRAPAAVLLAMTIALSLAACASTARPGAPAPSATPVLSGSSAGTPGPSAVGVPDPAPSVAAGPTTPLSVVQGEAEWVATGVHEWGGSMNTALVLAEDDAWAAGHHDEGAALIRHWDGRSWREVAAPVRDVAIRTVSAAPGSRVPWIFTGDARAWRRQGGGWVSMGGPAGPRGRLLRAAAVTGAREAWTAGVLTEDGETPFLAHWSGGVWRELASPGGMEVEAFGASSPREVWAVGVAGGHPAITRWDGERWAAAPLPAAPAAGEGHLTGVAVSPSGEAWAVGRVNRPGEPPENVLFTWDGSRWTAPVVPASRLPAFTAVAADGRGGVWIGGGRGGDVIVHYAAGHWTVERTPHRSSPAVYGLAAGPGGVPAIAVGGEPDYDEDGHAWIWTRR
ncbi:hypothetical protein ABZU32_07445 [Sphaerisporangium sp. NPDC005288]|uniref:WD40/YVTN/BNR-like repeat-containing protein n=1 Tax=Sphaerisporangium sp. NPDC005288 TaxID=3155114 RepID=UPI0033B5AB1C